MKGRYFYLIALVVAALDQLTKQLAVTCLSQADSVHVIDNLLYLTVVQNDGGAFGLFQAWGGVLTLITAAAIAGIIVFARRKSTLPTIVLAALSLQLGGAVGNLIDRMRLGYVVDFIKLSAWPVFNLADSAITVGVLLLAYYLIFCGRDDTDVRASDVGEEG